MFTRGLGTEAPEEPGKGRRRARHLGGQSYQGHNAGAFRTAVRTGTSNGYGPYEGEFHGGDVSP